MSLVAGVGTAFVIVVGFAFSLTTVGGTDGGGNHHNFMEQFVTFVWAYYTEHQRPRVPAMTDVGRFLFTYVWRHQHNLLR